MKVGDLEFEPCGHTSHYTCIPPRPARADVVYAKEDLIDEAYERGLVKGRLETLYKFSPEASRLRGTSLEEELVPPNQHVVAPSAVHLRDDVREAVIDRFGKVARPLDFFRYDDGETRGHVVGSDDVESFRERHLETYVDVVVKVIKKIFGVVPTVFHKLRAVNVLEKLAQILENRLTTSFDSSGVDVKAQRFSNIPGKLDRG